MSESEATSDQDDVSFIRTDDMVCLQCSEIGERVCLAAEGFGNRHCFLEPIANKNYPPEMPSCVFVIEQALSVRALQEMITADAGEPEMSAGTGAELGPAGAAELGSDELMASSGVDGSDTVANQAIALAGAGSGGAGAGSGSGNKGSVAAAESGLGGGNRTLLYGHAVLLRHLHSGMYLATLSICSSSDKLAFDVGLKGNRELGEFCWWTVHPGSKQRSEGEKVRVGDDLILVSVATERYLHYTTVENHNVIPPMASASALSLAAQQQQQQQQQQQESSRQAIVNASFHSTHWSISPFGTGLSRVKNVGYVFGGQVLRLLHGGDECLTVSAQQTVTEVAGPPNQQQQQQQQQASSSQQTNVAHRERSNTATRQYTDVIYEGGAVMNQARSLWRLDLIRTRWSGGFVQYSNALRIRHITTGKYLGVNDQSQLCLVPKIEASVERTAFCLKLTKDDSKGSKGSNESDDKDEEVIGSPVIKYGDSSFFIQHVYSQMWLSYRSYETKRRGVGRVEEKQAILSAEGKMDDCLEFSRSQEEEAKTARVIRKCDALFSRFIKILDHIQQIALMNKMMTTSTNSNNNNNNMSSNMFVGAPGSSLNSSTGQQESSDNQDGNPRSMSKKRASLTASAVAAAALSSLAPIMKPTSTSASGGHQKQSASPTQSVAEQMTPGGTWRSDPMSLLGAGPSSLFPCESQLEMSKCLEDLIEYFAPPEEGCDHEQEQSTLRALRNRQDLFQEEGILNLILDAIDKINLISGQGLLVLLLGEESSSTWDTITGYFYHLLAAIIKDNHTNCAQFAQSHRLNWLFSRLSSPQASEGTGMLDVLHFVLVDSPEALNMLKESHIKVLISLLEKHGRDPKVLNVLCSLCVSNGVAIRSSQNTITNHLLPSRDLLLQTRLVDHVASMRPNIYVARVEGSAMYHRWYYELVVDHIELINNLSPHLRVGWANTRGYHPYPGSGSQWGTNGVGDDFYSYGFDGQYLWTAGRPTLVRIPPVSTMTQQEMLNNQSIDYQNQHQALLESYAAQQNEFVSTSGALDTSAANQQQQQQQTATTTSITNYDNLAHSNYLRLQKNDVIGCLIDLSIPTIQFTINGKQIFGFFKNFNVLNGGFFHPVISFSAKVSCRFLFGANQGELYYRPPVGFSPLVDVLLPNQEVSVESCFSFGDLAKQLVSGPKIAPDSVPQLVADLVFIPKVVDTYSIEVSQGLESLRDSLAENMHELWCMSRIEDGWIFADQLDEHNRAHPYIAPFDTLPALAKKYKLDLASQTLKIILGLGYKIIKSQGQDRASAAGTRVKTYRLPNNPYLQTNGYKPAPLDLVGHELTPKMNRLVELLAENIHNIWAAEKISLKWTYRRRDPMNETGEDYNDGRSHHLLPYSYVDDEIKLKNRQTALETVFTILTYGFHIEFANSNSNRLATDFMLPMATGDNSDQMNNLMSSVGTPVAGVHTPNGLMSPRAPSRATMSGSPGGLIRGESPSAGELTGHETLLNNARPVGIRHLRAERTYAVYSGRWYYEVEVHTLGHIQVGWANLSFQSNSPHLGSDENSWAFDCHTGRKVHASNYESFGQVASQDDVIGCMLDLNDRTISYSLNGKLLLDYLGNEIAFSYADLPGPAGELGGYVPAISLGANQRVRLSFGQDIENLKYFTDYGLQEGYQPFCVNMHKPMTLWYNKREPNFVNLDDLDASQVNIEVTRIPSGSDSPPALKIAYKSFESQERANWEYLRLSLPVTINSELVDESDKLARMQEIQAQHLRMAYSKVGDAGAGSCSVMRALIDGDSSSSMRHPARLEQHMLQSGFSIADIKDLQRTYDNQSQSHNSHSNYLGSMKQAEVGVQGSSGILQRQQQQQQRRQQLVKTRSVDDAASSVGPKLAVPSFTEAQRLMSADGGSQASKTTLAKRRNTGFHLRKNVDSQPTTGDSQQLNITDDANNYKTSSKRSTIKSIFGNIRTRSTDTMRSRSLSRSGNGAAYETAADKSHLHLTIPKISIQNEHTSSDSSSRRLPGLSGSNRSRSVSRSESYSNLSQLGSADPSFQAEASGDSLATGHSTGRGLVRRLSRVGLGPKSASKVAAAQSYQQDEQQASQLELETKFDLQNLNPASLELISEYHYGVRIFPGQEPSHVLCGWVTSHFKHENMSSPQDVQHIQIIQSTSLITGQAEICERRECYMLNAGQLYKEMQPKSGEPSSASGGNMAGSSGSSNASGNNAADATLGSSRTNRGMIIGCHIDTSTGVLSFTVDGKLTKHKFNLEPNTKLYPGIFFQATTGDCLQFELSNTGSTLPLSSAIFSLTSKHVQPQCPPRLKVQTLRSSSWARVPNVSLRPNSLKLPRGWSMLADDPLSMLVVHIPEENRCLDVLELIEHEKLLRFHSNTLTLYGALCAQGNHKVAHIICSHIDQRQLLYAINSNYLSGDLRRGFADLLIALHLEFHAYGRHLTQNEFIVPITNELCRLYGDTQESDTAPLVHSFSRIECVSIRTELNMSPMGFDLSLIESSMATNNEKSFLKMLSTPYFPINTLKRLVFQALDEAVYKGNLPIRDLPGGSNENLFVPLLKLADKLLLIGCVTNQELCWLLNLIDPETFKRPKSEQNINPNSNGSELAGLSFLATGAQVPSSTWKPTILESSKLMQKSSQQASKGLLQMRKLDEQVKLTVCHILHHLLDIQLRHRIESIMAFSVNFVGHLQTDQRRRYEEIKSSNLPSHLTAKKTREFRCSPREQMRYILNFKADSSSAASSSSCSPSSEGLRNMLKSLHSSMMKQIKVIIESSDGDNNNNNEAKGHNRDSNCLDYLDDLDGGNESMRSYARRRVLDSTASSSASSLIFASFRKLIKFVKLIKHTITNPNLLHANSTTTRQLLDGQNGQLDEYLLMGGGGSQTELRFIKEIVKTVMKWAEESTIENKQLVREMFHLLLRCYNGVGELIEALNNSYVIGEKSKQDVIELLQVLSKVRALLAVQMGPAEEEVMRDCLWTLVNNVVFFQHPDLIRILRVHENVMHVMMNTLSKRSREAQSANPSVQSPEVPASPQQQQQERARTQSVADIQQVRLLTGAGGGPAGGQVVEMVDDAGDGQEDDISKMVVSCCRFLCFFCRSSSKNQKAMFEHLGFLLENSNILLSRPSLRGSTPLDVAYSSLMENHELVLALRESYLEKIAIYLSRCGLQSNQELLDKGYPDVGWDPIEGERYLDFLRFCVWVNGESVEENSNLVIRLLIRRPECLGPALRGEGCGLFAAIKDAIAMADAINNQQIQERREKQRQNNNNYGIDRQQQPDAGPNNQESGDSSEEDEDKINMGSAILNFYCALVDLLGRCAPESLTIGQGKHESIRARSILRSLVPLQDLKNAISLRFSLVNPQMLPMASNNAASDSASSSAADSVSSFMPNHKQSLVLFLERVYGIEDQETFFSLLEEAFLPDMRAATMLERCLPPAAATKNNQKKADYNEASESGLLDQTGEPDDSENEMTLALNRYLGNSAIPLMIKESRYFKNAENYANLLEPTLHTIYRLSKVKILTKGQRESVSDFLISLTREMQPHQLLKLLRKLTVDVSVLNESTTVALKLLTLHYERCSKYYGYTGSAQTSASGVIGTATEEERGLTMVLFTNIFDSLSRIDYEPELFEDSLPCLNALACALPPDYSLTESREFSVKPKPPTTTNKSSSQHQHGKASQDAANSTSGNHVPQAVGPYVPQPVCTIGIELNNDLRQMAKRFSEHYHDAWACRKLDRDWSYGEMYSFKNKVHPRLRPYSLLTQHERDRYIEPIEEAIKAIIAMGWSIERAEQDGSSSRQLTSTTSLSRPSSRNELPQTPTSSSTNSLLMLEPKQKLELIQNYNPQPVDTSNLSLSRELQNLSERSAENAHDSWAKKTIEDWQNKLRATANDILRTPIMLHPLMVPYDLLTDREKKKNRERSQELLKYMLFEGYKVFRADEMAYQQQQQMSRSRINSRAGADLMQDASRPDQLSASSKRRFAYSILTKLLAYTDTVMVKLELLKPSANFSRRSSFKQTDRDVKFFSKVVLPLIERYFTAHREFFVAYYGAGSSASGQSTGGAAGSPSGGAAVSQVDVATAASEADAIQATSEVAGSQSRGIGCATVKEKEMLGTLFCKLAAILRNKLPVIGPDAKIFVRCLQVLTRALDARTLSESCPDFIKTSMLTYFSKTALDLSQCVFNLQVKRYNAIRGTTMRTNSSLYHVHLGILPTLTALFDHLASSETGRYLLIDDIQVSCQKILQSLYILGTRIQLTGNHNFSKRELIRHRQSYGNCLAAFATAFPIAFLEPELVAYNRFSTIYTKRNPALKSRAQPQAATRATGELVVSSEISGTNQQAASISSSSIDMPALPKLEELVRLVNKFVQTGKISASSETNARNNNTPGSGSARTGASVGSMSSTMSVATPQLASSTSNLTGSSASSGLNSNRANKTDKNNILRMVPTDNDAAIIEVIVPLLCSYMPFWYSQGPEASPSARNHGAGPGCTSIVSKHLVDLLRDIMNLIRNHVGVEDGPNSNWLVTIAAHASQIIIDSNDTHLLKESFLPLSTKIVQRAESIYHREEVMRGYLKSMAEDTTAIEEKIQEEFHILVRDIYAFYPLLIRYADYKKSSWLKQTGSGKAQGSLALTSGTGVAHHQRKQQTADQNNSGAMASSSNDADLLMYQQEEAETEPEQLLFQHVATVFDIWSNSQYFRREEQNFISQHEIDNMALFMPASNRPGRVFFQKSDPIQSSSTGRRKSRRKQGEKRDRDKEIASSLLVVALKRLLPIGMNLFEGRERELIQHVKERFLKKDPQSRVEEIVRLQLTQPYQIDPSDEYCWLHHLYSRLGAQSSKQLAGRKYANKMMHQDDSPMNGSSNGQLARVSNNSKIKSASKSFMDADSGGAAMSSGIQVDAKLVARIVDMARVFYGLHIIDHPNLQQKMGKKSCVSTQRRRVVIACFRMTSLHSLPRHRAINIFLRSYCDTWLLDENLGQEKLIEDLTQTFEQAEMKINQGNNLVPKNDPLCQLIMTLSRQATTEHAMLASNRSGVDHLYLQFADIFRLSCGNDDDDDDENDGDTDQDQDKDETNENSEGAHEMGETLMLQNDEPEEDEDSCPRQESGASTIHEQEMEKQRLLFQQSRLSDRGVAEMILLYVSAFSRYQGASGGAGSSSGSGGGAAGHSLSQQTPTILSTLKLGISILRGGNVEVQRRMLKHLKDKKDVGFFTSIQSLMSCCSVLDLDAFERNLKAEALGVRSEGAANEKNMYDAEFTCKLFRFFQLLCEGHNLEFQNYLRTQAGNTTTVNVVIATVDYLLRLQESIMDFYWHYSSKEVIDSSGIENFIKAITIAKQVFCTLTESIQGPCPQNQQALAHSRLWHAVGGFLFLFAHMQDKLSRNSSQLALLIELLDLQKEMVIMMLSMLEGNVVNGTIGKQMVETLVESAGNVEIILKFFDLFLKLPRLTSSTNFQEYDKTGSGWISLSDLKKAMEQHKIYTAEETQYLLSCCEPNHDGMIDYREFIDRFHQPAKDIGFNLAVLLTNLAEHITNEPRLQRFLETASTVLSYFEPYLGRIEIMGSSKRIERVYFEIKESTLNQWAKPQIQESKRAFFYSIVTEGDGKEKLEAFVNFCEDTIFEMQHASKILGESEEEAPSKASKYPFETAASSASGDASSPGAGSPGSLAGHPHHHPQYSSGLNHKLIWRLTTTGFMYLFQMILALHGSLQPSRVRRRILYIRRMSYRQILVALVRLFFNIWLGLFKLTLRGVSSYSRLIFRIMTDGQLMSSKHEQDNSLKAGGARLPVAGSEAAGLKKVLAPRIEPVKFSSPSSTSSGSSSAAAANLARTELITGPSIMTASVTDVLEDNRSSEPALASSKGNNSKKGSLATDEHQLTGDTGQQMAASTGSTSAALGPFNECADEGGYMGEISLLDDNMTKAGPHKRSKSGGLANKLAQLTCYNQKIVSFLARNFYRIKLLALVTAFIINFILLFYKVTEWTSSDLEKSSYSITLLRGLRGSSSDDDGEVETGTQSELEQIRLSATGNPRSRLEAIERKLAAGLLNYGRLNGDEKEEDGEEVGDFDVLDSEDSAASAASSEGSEEEEGENDEGEEDGEEETAEEDEKEDETSTGLIELVIIEEKYYYLQPILTLLASVHSIFSLCMLIAYYHLKVPLVIFKREKEIARKLEFDGIYISEEPDSENWWNGHWDRLVISAASFPDNYWDKFVKKRVREKYREQYDYELLSNLLGMDKNSSSSGGGSAATRSRAASGGAGTGRGRLASFLMGGWLQVDWRYQLWKAGVTLTDQSFQYQLLYLIFSLAGHFNYFFFAAHLLDVAVGFKKLQTILQSVTHNGKQLVLTVMLLTIVVYIYTVIAFNFFRKFYVQGEESPDAKCNSMMTCFVYHLYQGVRAGGGIGDVIEAPDGDDYEVYRIIFDITFFFSVIIILLAIIQGLIIDAFGELRDQLLTVAADMESNCFICGIGKDVLDKVPRGFDTHVQKEHNLANYMFFLMHLINKPDTDYTGQETYVWELYQRRCWDFFPVGECFRTQSEEEADAKPVKD